MLLVINDTHAVSAQCGTLRRQPGQTTWAALREHAEKGCTWLQQMAHGYRGECLQARGRWLLSGVSQCKPDGSEIYFVLVRQECAVDGCREKGRLVRARRAMRHRA
jgi:hypothetical protein